MSIVELDNKIKLSLNNINKYHKNLDKKNK